MPGARPRPCKRRKLSPDRPRKLSTRLKLDRTPVSRTLLLASLKAARTSRSNSENGNPSAAKCVVKYEANVDVSDVKCELDENGGVEPGLVQNDDSAEPAENYDEADLSENGEKDLDENDAVESEIAENDDAEQDLAASNNEQGLDETDAVESEIAENDEDAEHDLAASNDEQDLDENDEDAEQDLAASNGEQDLDETDAVESEIAENDEDAEQDLAASNDEQDLGDENDDDVESEIAENDEDCDDDEQVSADDEDDEPNLSEDDVVIEGSQNESNSSEASSESDPHEIIEDEPPPEQSIRTNYEFQHVSDANIEKHEPKSEDSDLDSIQLDFDPSEFKHSLSTWSEGVDNQKINELLKILRKHGTMRYLPRKGMNLVYTPFTTKDSFIGSGIYCHIGVEKKIRALCAKHPEIVEKSTIINLQCNFDEIPIGISRVAWPILMSLVDFPHIPPFLVGLYFGAERVEDCDRFLADYVREMTHLTNSGIQIEEVRKNVSVTSYVCSTNPMAYVQNISNYNCTKCTIKGTFMKHQMSYKDNTNTKTRTDKDFDNMTYIKEHHLGNTPSLLTQIPGTKMVSHFPLDYTNLLCLGVMRKMLLALMKGKSGIRLTDSKLNSLNELMQSIGAFIPLELEQKPRSLIHLLSFKATELRQILMYTGPFIFLDMVSENCYLHFLSLFHATRILSSPVQIRIRPDHARQLLEHYVKSYAALYGEESVSLNVHSLLHLVDDAQVHGTLDKFSSFTYLNQRQLIKALLTKDPEKPVHCVLKRLDEDLCDAAACKRKGFEYLKNSVFRRLPRGFSQPCYKSHSRAGRFLVSVEEPDNCVILKSGDVVLVQFIGIHTSKLSVLARKFGDVRDFYVKPALSRRVGVCQVADIARESEVYDFNEIRSKAMLIPLTKQQGAYYAAEIFYI